MKATLTFNLDDSEDAHAFKIHTRAMSTHLFLEDFADHLMRKYKHADPKEGHTALDEIEELRAKFWEMRSERVDDDS